MAMGLCHLKSKRRALLNERCLHLGAIEVGLQSTLQAVLGTMLMFCTAMNQLLVLVEAAKSVAAAPINLSVLDAAFDSVAVGLMGFPGLLCALRVADGILFDIPPNKEDAHFQFSQSKNLHMNNLRHSCVEDDALQPWPAALPLQGI